MKLLICVAFHFRQHRLTYLQQVLQQHVTLAPEFEIFITTNTVQADEIALIQSVLPAAAAGKISVVSFVNLDNPWMLTWGHKQIMQERFVGSDFTHFIYTEDDIEIRKSNMQYWLAARDMLRPYHNLYPSFMRVEWHAANHQWVSTDLIKVVSLAASPKLYVEAADAHFINVINPYQGCFLYDRELMAEHIASDTFNIAHYGNIAAHNVEWGGGMAENANFALTFQNVPQGCHSRNFIPYFEKYQEFDRRAFVHHLPNNYAENPATLHGKIDVNAIMVD